ncbi:hypothetical protein BuS5_03684 [Desulfosarcina sp. BuS5]|uniref:dockerin type I repeat-containing protein n=1 Tax=Desulfosarcina sp. BuS5 TaxID=933262 RepID=UPI00047F6644|nr:dockerin type I repeat-containing protein [Desulfosarcina sp. BuS5]WDN90713.1 hypothetical protein BuS5_03684 [Desulfosarcina sp. BuS5]
MTKKVFCKNEFGWFSIRLNLIISACFFFISAFLNTGSSMAGCPPDQYQENFYGIIVGIVMQPNDELRAYIKPEEIEYPDAADEEAFDEEGTESEDYTEIFLGGTDGNPGRMEVLDGNINFSIYLCGEISAIGEEVEFRYARGKKEYIVKIAEPEGSEFFEGRQIEITNISDINKSRLVLEVTRKTAGGEDDTEQEVILPVHGDLNGDYKVNSSDASMVLHHILFEGGDDPGYDINGDGTVNNDDVKEIYIISRGGRGNGNSPFSATAAPFARQQDSPFKKPANTAFTQAGKSPFEKKSSEAPFADASGSQIKQSSKSPFTVPGQNPFSQSSGTIFTPPPEQPFAASKIKHAVSSPDSQF